METEWGDILLTIVSEKGDVKSVPLLKSKIEHSKREKNKNCIEELKVLEEHRNKIVDNIAYANLQSGEDKTQYYNQLEKVDCALEKIYADLVEN